MVTSMQRLRINLMPAIDKQERPRSRCVSSLMDRWIEGESVDEGVKWGDLMSVFRDDLPTFASTVRLESHARTMPSLKRNAIGHL